MPPDSKKDYFAERASTFDQGAHRVRNVDMIADAIRKQVALTPEMTVMDFGAGTGLLLERIAPKSPICWPLIPQRQCWQSYKKNVLT